MAIFSSYFDITRGYVLEKVNFLHFPKVHPKKTARSPGDPSDPPAEATTGPPITNCPKPTAWAQNLAAGWPKIREFGWKLAIKEKNVAYHNSIYVSIYVYMFCKFKFHGLLGASLRDKPMKAFTLRSLRSGALQELWDVKPWPLNLSWFGHFTPGWTTTWTAGMTQPIPHVEICRVEWDELGRLGKISSEPLKWKTMGEAIKIGREQQFDRHAMNHQQNEFTKRNTNQILPEQATETSYTFKTWEGEACIFFSRSATHLERPVTVMAPWIRRDRPSKSCSRPSK